MKSSVAHLLILIVLLFIPTGLFYLNMHSPFLTEINSLILVYLPFLLALVILFYVVKINRLFILLTLIIFMSFYALLIFLPKLDYFQLSAAQTIRFYSIFFITALLLAYFFRRGKILQLKLIFFVIIIGVLSGLYLLGIKLADHYPAFSVLRDILFFRFFSQLVFWQLPDLFTVLGFVFLLWLSFFRKHILIPFNFAAISGVFPLIWMANLYLIKETEGGTYTTTFYFPLLMLIVCVSLLYALFFQAKIMFYTDAIMEIPNQKALQNQLNRLRQKKSVLTIALVNIDSMEKNKSACSEVDCLHMARFIAKQLREHTGNRAYCYTDNQFMIIFPKTTSEYIFPLLNEVRKIINSKRFFLRGEKIRKKSERGAAKTKPTLKITVSIGLAHTSRKFTTPEDIIFLAKRALFKAQQTGQNKICALNFDELFANV